MCSTAQSGHLAQTRVQSPLPAMLQVQYLEPTPPDQDLVITSEVSKISEADENSGRKDSVEVAMALSQVPPACACISALVMCTYVWSTQELQLACKYTS